jgi:hypothetical protein
MGIPSGAEKWRFSAQQTHLWLIKVWFSASTFVVKIATFAKPENVMGKFKKQHRRHGQTREPPTFNFDSSRKIFCKIENKKLSPETTIINGATPKSLTIRIF